MTSTCVEIWNKCLRFIEDNIPSESFNTWFRPLKACDFSNDVLTLESPNQFYCEYIDANYANILGAAVKKVIGINGKIVYQVLVCSTDGSSEFVHGVAKEDTRNVPVMPQIPQQGGTIPNPFVVPGLKRMEIDSQLKPECTFDNFVEGECNRIARSAGLAIADKPGKTAFNPLLIYSSTGLGKTHLCHAIGLKVKHTFPDKIVLYVQTEQFVNQYVSACKNKALNDFIHFYQMIDVLIIDDIQFLSGKTRTQETFFHIFNHFHQNGKQLVLTSDKRPIDLADMETRLLSRFKWGLSVDLQMPDETTRAAIIRSKLYNDGVQWPDEVVDFLAANVKTNVRELEGVVVSITARSLFARRQVTLELAQEVLEQFVRNSKSELSVSYILEVVCDFLAVSKDDVFKTSRKRQIVEARQLTMFFAKKYTKESLAMIGQECGNKDHSTVIHACKTVQNRIETDKQFKNIVLELEKKISL